MKGATAVGKKGKALLTLISSAVPFWGQTIHILTIFSPEQDCAPKRAQALQGLARHPISGPFPRRGFSNPTLRRKA